MSVARSGPKLILLSLILFAGVQIELQDDHLAFGQTGAQAGAAGRACPGQSGRAPIASPQQSPAIPPELQNDQTTISISADSQHKVKDIYELLGHVVITYRQMQLTADKVTYDDSSGEAVARGQVIFTDPKAYLEADEAHYNVLNGKGWFASAQGYVHSSVHPRRRLLVTENPFYVRAKKVQRLGEETYTVEDGHLSLCEDENKGWSLAAHRARLEVDKNLVTYGDVFRFLRVPILYVPVLVHSLARNPRQTGFSLPQIGHSGQKGTIIGEGFFWAINPSADLLLGLQNFSERGLGSTARFRARPSSSSEITVNYFGVDDRGFFVPGQSVTTGGQGNQAASTSSQKIGAPGESVKAAGQARNLAYGFRGVLDVDYVNSLAFRFTFTDTFTEAVTSEAHQTGFLTKNFGAYSLNFYASRYQDFLSTERKTGNSIIIQQTPSFSFSGIDQQIGRSPFYFAFDTSAAGVARTEPGFATQDLSERLDFHPQVTLRSKPLWGFHLTPTVGLRATRYGTSLKRGRDPLTRLLGEFSFDLRPPSLERILSQTYWGHRFKHVITPEIRYRLVRARDAEDIKDVVRFDQIDVLAETNEIEYSLTNSILTRKDAPEGQMEKGSARELMSLRLSQKYYFDPTFGGALEPGRKVVFDPTVSLTGFAFAQGRRLSPVVSVLKFAPFSNYDTELRADFNPSGGGVLNAGITSYVHRGPVGLAVTDFFVNRTAALSTPMAPGTSPSNLPSFNLLRTVFSYGEVNRKGLSGALGLDYNFSQGIAHQVVSQVSYNFGCFGLDFEYRRFALGPLRRENQFRVAVSLANVGTFGNLKPRERLY